MGATQSKTNKNSLIELYRFIFAILVVKNHGFFPYQGAYFSPGRIAVEFFFVLSGWFTLKTINKYKEMPYFKGLFCLFKDKILTLGIPLIIGLAINIPYKIIVGTDGWWDFSIWGYLWYVHDMLIVFAFYYSINKFIKSKKSLIIITAVVFVITAILHAIPYFYSWGYFRAFSMMSLGMLISLLPRIKLKHQNLLWIPLSCVFVLVLKMLLFDFTFIEEEILDLILYPAMIYLTFQLPVKNRVFNYLGSISFGLYAYQCVTRFLRLIGLTNIWILFIIIVFLTVTTDLLKRYIASKKLQNIQKLQL